MESSEDSFALLLTGVVRGEKIKIDILKRFTQLLHADQVYRNLQKVKNGIGHTALHCLAIKGNTKALKLILQLFSLDQQYELLTLRDDSLCTVVHQVAQHGVTGVATLLANFNQDQLFSIFQKQNMPGNAAVIHYAAWQGHTDTVKYILDLLTPSQRFQILKLRNKLGNTPLHLAVCADSEEIITYMLDSVIVEHRTALLNVGASQGQTACGVASYRHKKKAAACLKRYRSECMRQTQMVEPGVRANMEEVVEERCGELMSKYSLLQEKVDGLERLCFQQTDNHTSLLEKIDSLVEERNNLLQECKQRHDSQQVDMQTVTAACAQLDDKVTANHRRLNVAERDIDYLKTPTGVQAVDDEEEFAVTTVAEREVNPNN